MKTIPKLKNRTELQEKGLNLPIKEVNWGAFPNNQNVQAEAILGYTEEEGENFLLVEFRVSENELRAVALQDNEKVFQDSCVEFFFSFKDSTYRNFEFNCLGVMLAGEGEARENRTLLGKEITLQIERKSSLEKQGFKAPLVNATNCQALFIWTLQVAIPLPLLGIKGNISKKEIKANFYKCGDLLTEPHYLSWQPIKTQNPDFHRPEFFGELIFE